MNQAIDIRELNERIQRESSFVDLINLEMNKVIVGQKHLVESLLIGLLSDGHILLEGVPGLAKTLAIKSLAQTIDARFARIQFTPDLLPADLVGTMVYSQKKEEFSVKKGPIFANFILADEINRAPAKVQSALLEAMQEGNVTIEGETHALPAPFLVVATQNPIELEGTFPLPEAQIDRFMMRLSMGYPDERDEIAMVSGEFTGGGPVTPVGSPEEVEAARKATRLVYLSPEIATYLTELVRATRTAPGVELGASPRASRSSSTPTARAGT